MTIRLEAERHGGRLILPPGGAMPAVGLKLDAEPPPGATWRLRIELDGLTYSASEAPCLEQETLAPLPGLLEAEPGQEALLVVELQAGWQTLASLTQPLRVAPFILCSSLDPPLAVVADGPDERWLAAVAAAGVEVTAGPVPAALLGLVTWPGGERPFEPAGEPGHIIASPPCVDERGRHFPQGRLVIDEAAPAEQLALFAAQRLQWPPVGLDLSWLPGGRVADLVQFVPDPAPPGFAVLLPSPAAARLRLAELADQGCAEAGELLRLADPAEQEAVDRALRETRRRLAAGLGLPDSWERFIAVPALYRQGRPLLTNLCGTLVLGSHLIVPELGGPQVDGRDALFEPLRQQLLALGLTVHTVAGAANAVVRRRPVGAEWWQLGDPAAAARLERPPHGAEILGRWLAARADGEWEAAEGIDLRSTDAPGWEVRLPLWRSPLDGATLSTQSVTAGSEEWAEWWIDENCFHARCGPSMLEFVLQRFAALAAEADDA